jgi:hypothetical protein
MSRRCITTAARAKLATVIPQPDGGGLAGVVGAKVAEYLTLLDHEVEIEEAAAGAVVLGQTCGLDRSRSHRACLLRHRSMVAAVQGASSVRL